MIVENEVLTKQRFQDIRWARRNTRLNEQFAGELVVVHRQQVIAHGHDEAELLAQATSLDHPREELVVVEILPPDFEMPLDSL